MAHKKEEGTYHCNEICLDSSAPGKVKGVPLLLITEYSGINKGQRVPDRSKTAYRKPFVKCFLTVLWKALSPLTTHYLLPGTRLAHTLASVRRRPARLCSGNVHGGLVDVLFRLA